MPNHRPPTKNGISTSPANAARAGLTCDWIRMRVTLAWPTSHTLITSTRPTGAECAARSAPTHSVRNGASAKIATMPTGVNTPFRNSSDWRASVSA